MKKECGTVDATIIELWLWIPGLPLRGAPE
jgi:hypothetical protein